MDAHLNVTNATTSEFTSSNAQLSVGEQKFSLRILKMQESTLLILCNAEPEIFDEMAVAVPMKPAIATTIMGPHIISESQRLAESLTKRFKRQFFVSFNANVDRLSAPFLEKELSEYIRQHTTELE